MDLAPLWALTASTGLAVAPALTLVLLWVAARVEGGRPRFPVWLLGYLAIVAVFAGLGLWLRSWWAIVLLILIGGRMLVAQVGAIRGVLRARSSRPPAA